MEIRSERVGAQYACLIIEIAPDDNPHIHCAVVDSLEQAAEFAENLDGSILHNISTGTCGVNGLLAIERMLDAYVAEQSATTDVCISLVPSDERRANAYWRRLSRRGPTWSRCPISGWIWHTPGQNFCLLG